MRDNEKGIIGGLIASAATSIPWVIGFTKTGVAATSTAATIQAGFGGTVTAGSTFAIMQSIGATTIMGTPIGLGAAAVGGAVFGAIKLKSYLK